MFLLRLDDRIYRLLDAEIDNFITIVSQNNIDKVLTYVMNVTFNSGNQELCFSGGFTFCFLHEWLEISHSALHGLGTLKHEGKLHLPGAEQLTNHFHSIEQERIDYLQWFVLTQTFLERRFKADPLAINDVLLETFLHRKICQ